MNELKKCRKRISISATDCSTFYTNLLSNQFLMAVKKLIAFCFDRVEKKYIT